MKVETKDYTFEVKKEAKGKWYVDACVNGEPNKVIHKWAVTRTRKAALEYIKYFIS